MIGEEICRLLVLRSERDLRLHSEERRSRPMECGNVGAARSGTEAGSKVLDIGADAFRIPLPFRNRDGCTFMGSS